MSWTSAARIAAIYPGLVSSGLQKVRASPGEAGLAESHREQIGGTSAIAVWERANPDPSVIEPRQRVNRRQSMGHLAKSPARQSPTK